MLINKDELRNTYETKDDYVILANSQKEDLKKSQNLKETSLTDQYSSDNVDLFTIKELKEILIKENLLPDLQGKS